MEYTDQREEFLKKYDELKIRQARNLDPLVYLLSKITDDKEMLSSLSRVYGPEKEDVEDKSNVKVLNVVDGITVQLPEQGVCVWYGDVCVWYGDVCVWYGDVCVWYGDVCVWYGDVCVWYGDVCVWYGDVCV